jgi:hypothetical protein
MANRIPHGEPRRRVNAALRDGVSPARIATYLGWTETEFIDWLTDEAPDNWRRAYLYGKKETFRKSLRGVGEEEYRKRLTAWEEEHDYARKVRRK